CYLGHVDTVLADASDWSVDPWSGELKDDMVWGRGALDMKCQVAAEVAAACALAEEGWRPESGELMVVVTADEEAGGAHGAQGLLEALGVESNGDLLEGFARLEEKAPMLGVLLEPLAGITFSPTMIRASEKINVIPARAELKVDCRVPPGLGEDDVRRSVEQV